MSDDDELLRILFDKRAARASNEAPAPARPSLQHLPMVDDNEDVDVMEEDQSEDTPPTLIASDTGPRPGAQDLMRVLMASRDEAPPSQPPVFDQARVAARAGWGEKPAEQVRPTDGRPLPQLKPAPNFEPPPPAPPPPAPLPMAVAVEAPRPEPRTNRPEEPALPPLSSLRNRIPVEAPPPSVTKSSPTISASTPVGLLIIVLAVLAIALAVAGGGGPG